MKIALLFVGFGHVARRFVRMLDDSREALAARHIEPVIVGIITRRHGGFFDAAGLDPDQATAAFDRSAGPNTTPAMAAPALIARLGIHPIRTRVLVETTTLDVRSGEPAISHVRAGFAAGAHVITANKGPAAFAYAALRDEAARAGVRFLFEGAVMDGIPIFNLVRETLPAVRIDGFRGVVNSTTNHLLTAMEHGEAFDAALARMQAEGVAEADPSLDLDGWDAAAKTAALANVLLDARLTPLAIPRARVDAALADRARDLLASGRRLKVVATARRRGDRVDARVALETLDATDPLAIIDGQANALEFDTSPTGRIVVTQRDGGLEKTAYALLSDLLAVATSPVGAADR